MEEAGRAERDDGRPDIAVRDDLYPEDVGNGASGREWVKEVREWLESFMIGWNHFKSVR